MPNPNGNPGLKKFAFKPKGKVGNPCKLQVRVTKAVFDAVNAQPDPSTFMRKAIEDALNSLDTCCNEEVELRGKAE